MKNLKGLPVTQKQLENQLINYGFWSKDGKDAKLRYQLSPDAFVLTTDYQKQLDEIGIAVKDYFEGLKRYGKYAIGTIGGDHTASMFKRLMVVANDGFPLLSEERNFPIAKVDLMINKQKVLKIAEIDGYNPRGNAYAIFLQEFYKKNIDKNAKMYKGIPSFLPSITGGKKLIWPYATKERYYAPMLKISSQMYEESTGDTIAVTPMAHFDIKNINEEMIYIIPWGTSWSNEKEAKDGLTQLYLNKPENFLYPLMPWLGSKAFMGILSNPTKNIHIDKILEYSQFNHLGLIRKYIPQTLLVGRMTQNEIVSFNKDKKSILKANVSSGMKDIFTDTHVDFEKKLAEASKMKKPNFILQEMVDQKTFPFNVFNENGDLEIQDHYIRITAYIGADGSVVDAEVTGRPEPDVHGAPDCIMIPCILE